MPRKEIDPVPEGNGPISTLGRIALKELGQALSEMRGEILGEFKESLRSMDQRLAGLKLGGRPPRLSIEADGPADRELCERMEGAAKAVQVMHGDSFSARWIQDGPQGSNTFDEKVEPPALSCRSDIVVKNGAAAPNSCLLPLEMRTTTVAGGLLPTGKTTTATWTTLDRLTLWLYPTEEKKIRTSTPSASYDSSSFWRNNLLVAPSCQKIIKSKLGQNMMFDPHGSKAVSAPARFGSVTRVVLWGAYRFGAAAGNLQRFLAGRMTWASTCRGEIRESLTPYVLRSIAVFPASRLALMPCQAMVGVERTARGYRTSGADGCRGASWSEELDGKKLRGALGGVCDQEPRGTPFSGHRLHGQPVLFIYYSVMC